MSIGFMVTNGGPHPPSKWADMTTRQIVDLIVIEPSAPAQAVIDKRQFETDLFKLLLELHENAQDSERTAIRHRGEHLLTPVDPREKATAAASRITALASSTPFAAHFAKPEVQTFLRDVLAQHFGDSMHIERCWHADRNPGDPHVKEFRKARK